MMRAKKRSRAPSNTVKLKDRYSGNFVWLTVRDGSVVGAMGSDPKRYLGMSIDQARHVARYGGSGKKTAHATIASASGDIGVGDIVQRSDGSSKNRYVVTNIRAPWIYTQRLGSGGTPGIITFPSQFMLRKVA